MTQPRVVFSVLFNEEDSFLPYLGYNFVFHTSVDCVLIVNSGVPIDPIILSGLDERIHVIAASSRRSKFGATLLLGHCESFEYASKRFAHFDFFVPIASNSLFVRRFDADLISMDLNAGATRHNEISLSSPPALFDWYHYSNLLPDIGESSQFSISLANAHIKYLRLAQIEGLISSFANWQQVVSTTKEILSSTSNLQVPLEELLPLAVFAQKGDGRYSYICRNLGRIANYNPRGITFVDLRLLIVEDSDLPKSIVLLKWFKRTTECFETWLVCTEDGVKAKEALRIAVTHARLASKSAELVNAINNLALVPRQRFSNYLCSAKFRLKGTFSINRSMVELTSGHGDNVGYLFFEHSGGNAEISVSCCESNLIACEAKIIHNPPSAESASILLAYLYVEVSKYVQLATSTIVLDLFSSNMLSSEDTAMLTRATVRTASGAYSVLPRTVKVLSDYSFSCEYNLGRLSDVTHLGLPVVSAGGLQWLVRFGSDPSSC